MAYVQLEGSAKFGPVAGTLVEFADEITSLEINTGRTLRTIAPTWGNATEDSKAGSYVETLTINFLSDPTAASSFYNELWDAIHTDEAELEFECNVVDAVTSTTNPLYTGVVIVTGLMTGGAAGEIRSQAQTFPIKAGSLVRTTTP